MPDGVEAYPRVKVQWRELLPGAVDPAMPAVHKMNAAGYGCTSVSLFAVNRNRPRRKRTPAAHLSEVSPGTQKDALYITALFADVDGGTSDENLARVHSINPSIVVKSAVGITAICYSISPLHITDDNRMT